MGRFAQAGKVYRISKALRESDISVLGPEEDTAAAMLTRRQMVDAARHKTVKCDRPTGSGHSAWFIIPTTADTGHIYYPKVAIRTCMLIDPEEPSVKLEEVTLENEGLKRAIEGWTEECRQLSKQVEDLTLANQRLTSGESLTPRDWDRVATQVRDLENKVFDTSYELNMANERVKNLKYDNQTLNNLYSGQGAKIKELNEEIARLRAENTHLAQRVDLEHPGTMQAEVDNLRNHLSGLQSDYAQLQKTAYELSERARVQRSNLEDSYQRDRTQASKIKDLEEQITHLHQQVQDTEAWGQREAHKHQETLEKMALLEQQVAELTAPPVKNLPAPFVPEVVEERSGTYWEQIEELQKENAALQQQLTVTQAGLDEAEKKLAEFDEAEDKWAQESVDNYMKEGMQIWKEKCISLRTQVYVTCIAMVITISFYIVVWAAVCIALLKFFNKF
jgi:predicted  nucleic acid-binding Zn-ribbon protein